jgi:ClpP class serine protease
MERGSNREDETMTIEKKPAEHVLAAIHSEPWLITEEALSKIIEIAARQNLIVTADDLAKIEERREALAAKKAARMDGTQRVTKRDGVAMIDVNGPIFRYSDVFNSISGGTTTESLALDFNAAMDDPSAEAVLFVFDSGGGQAKGINELANMIAGRRGEKPIGGYITGDAGSAAYWIAAAVDHGYLGIDATGFAGSVGARVALTKEKESTKSTTFEFVSKQSPHKNIDPETEAGRTHLQQRADELGGAFVDGVAKLRGVTVDQVLSDFGGGRMLMGKAAVEAGLVDGMTSQESMIQALKQKRRGYDASLSRVAATNNSKESFMFTKEMKVKLGLAETATDAEVEVRIAENTAKLTAMEADLKKEREEKLLAQAEKAKAEANALVDGWEREGIVSGNAVVKTRTIAVAIASGQPVTMDMFSEHMAAMPKVDTDRIATGAGKTTVDTEKPTAADFLAYDGGDKKAAAKIDAFTKKLASTDKSKKYVAHLKALRAEAMAS